MQKWSIQLDHVPPFFTYLDPHIVVYIILSYSYSNQSPKQT